ncbi:MAG: ribosomal protein S18-alanine N-acetyltransferase, partial [Gemmatimonadota bacterium]
YLVLWFVTDEGELADLAVDPEYRGRGIGGFLVGRAVERARARGVRSLFLEVRASNERALSLYRSRGFHVISVRKGYYSSPREDALVMLKSLW